MIILLALFILVNLRITYHNSYQYAMSQKYEHTIIRMRQGCNSRLWLARIQPYRPRGCITSGPSKCPLPVVTSWARSIAVEVKCIIVSWPLYSTGFTFTSGISRYSLRLYLFTKTTLAKRLRLTIYEQGGVSHTICRYHNHCANE